MSEYWKTPLLTLNKFYTSLSWENVQNSSSNFGFDVHTTKDFSNLDGLSAHQKNSISFREKWGGEAFFHCTFSKIACHHAIMAICWDILISSRVVGYGLRNHFWRVLQKYKICAQMYNLFYWKWVLNYGYYNLEPNFLHTFWPGI